MTSCVITGPTGAIGTALAEFLAERGITVFAVCRPDSARLAALPAHPQIRTVLCDLNNIRSLPDLIPQQVDVFYHFAWEHTFGAAARNDMESQVRNISHTLAAAACAKALGCHTFIGAGSQAECGRVTGRISGDTPAIPENGYGAAKYCASTMSRIVCEQAGLRHIWTRILSIYGPHDGKGTLVSSLILQLLNGERPACTAGEQLWDYLYSKDAAKAFYLLAERGETGKTYAIGSGSALPLRTYIETIRDCIDKSLPLGLGELPYSANQVMQLQADCSSLIRDTGFSPEYSFQRGILETIEWIKGECNHV